MVGSTTHSTTASVLGEDSPYFSEMLYTREAKYTEGCVAEIASEEARTPPCTVVCVSYPDVRRHAYSWLC